MLNWSCFSITFQCTQRKHYRCKSFNKNLNLEPDTRFSYATPEEATFCLSRQPHYSCKQGKCKKGDIKCSVIVVTEGSKKMPLKVSLFILTLLLLEKYSNFSSLLLLLSYIHIL